MSRMQCSEACDVSGDDWKFRLWSLISQPCGGALGRFLWLIGERISNTKDTMFGQFGKYCIGGRRRKRSFTLLRKFNAVICREPHVHILLIPEPTPRQTSLLQVAIRCKNAPFQCQYPSEVSDHAQMHLRNH